MWQKGWGDCAGEIQVRCLGQEEKHSISTLAISWSLISTLGSPDQSSHFPPDDK